MKLFDEEKQVNPLHGSHFIKGQSRRKRRKIQTNLFNKVKIPPCIKL